MIDYTFREQVRDVGPYLGTASIMGATVLAAGFLLPTVPDGFVPAIQALVGASVYVSLCHVTRMGAWKELIALQGLRLARDAGSSY